MPATSLATALRAFLYFRLVGDARRTDTWDALLAQLGSDIHIYCFQEVKQPKRSLPPELAKAPGFHAFFSLSTKAYSGVATFVRAGVATASAAAGLADDAFFGGAPLPPPLRGERAAALDREGRVVATDHVDFVLFNVYAPCVSGEDAARAEERRHFKRDFNAALEARARQLVRAGRHVVLAGDLNACASPRDHCFAMSEADFLASPWSRWIRRMLGRSLESAAADGDDGDGDSYALSNGASAAGGEGAAAAAPAAAAAHHSGDGAAAAAVPGGAAAAAAFVDCFRRANPAAERAFTCWNTKKGARANNYGTRIDYVLASAAFARAALRASAIWPHVVGSDHCPVVATFDAPRAHAAAAAAPHPPQCSCFLAAVAVPKLTAFFAPTRVRSGSGGGGSGNGDNASDSASQPPELACEAAEEDSTLSCEALFDVPAARFVQEPQDPILPPPCIPRAGATAVAPFFSGSSGGGANGVPRAQGFTTAAALSGGARRGGGGGSSSGSAHAPPAKRKRGMTQMTLKAFGAAAPRSGSAAAAAAPTVSSADAGGGRSAGNTGIGGDGGGGGVAFGGFGGSSGGGGPISCCGSGGGGDGRGSDASRAGSSGVDAKSAWQALLAKRPPPVCSGHREPAVERTVLKAGPNQGRRFYCCARGEGDWPKDPNARCNYFEFRESGARGYRADARARDQQRAKRGPSGG
ncbi:Endonuclease/exonuclease/phosphatase [Tribonema minus]|uniref:DNA-(apurinic or apyrimidinic site) endonuclease 2 n=1 Tax=Tribonema minus TaxID=303371 RepID=A0A835ZDF2_9STRA|nr:Endonuclease/exonuclease/phosphatase [Tribonema minus]